MKVDSAGGLGWIRDLWGESHNCSSVPTWDFSPVVSFAYVSYLFYTKDGNFEGVWGLESKTMVYDGERIILESHSVWQRYNGKYQLLEMFSWTLLSASDPYSPDAPNSLNELRGNLTSPASRELTLLYCKWSHDNCPAVGISDLRLATCPFEPFDINRQIWGTYLKLTEVLFFF